MKLGTYIGSDKSIIVHTYYAKLYITELHNNQFSFLSKPPENKNLKLKFSKKNEQMSSRSYIAVSIATINNNNNEG